MASLFFFFFNLMNEKKTLSLSSEPRSAPPSHANVSADHLTLAFSPDAQMIANFAPLLGSTGPRLRATGVADDGRVQAVVIEETEVVASDVFSLLPTTRWEKTAPHITVSVAPGMENREAGVLARKVVDRGLVSTFSSCPSSSSSSSSPSSSFTCANEEAISVSSWQGDPTFLSGTLGLMMESGRVVLAEEEWAEVARETEEEEKQRDGDNDKDVAAFLSTPPPQTTVFSSPSPTTTPSTATLSVDRLLEAWRLGEKRGVQAAVAASAANAASASASAAAAAAAAAGGTRLSFPSPPKKKSPAMLQRGLPSRRLEELTRVRELARMSREGQGRAERWLELWAGGRDAPATLLAETRPATCCSSTSFSSPSPSFSPRRSPSPSTALADPASQTAAKGEQRQEQRQKSPSPRLPSLSALAAVDMFEVSSPGSAPPEAACPLAVADVLSRGRAAFRARAAAREASDRERAISERHRAARAVFDRAAAVAAALGDEEASVELASRAWEHGALAVEARARANDSAFAGVNGGHVNRFRLDLHGMHVPEAVAALRRHCAALAGLAHPSGVLLQVVTGWGRNSSSGVPRVRPAVLQWLAANSHRYREDVNNAGMVYILLGGAGEWGNE